MIEQFVDVPKIVSQDRTEQRTVEQISDIPVPQVVKELLEIFKVFSEDRVQQRFFLLAISLAEKISGKLHAVNTVKVVKPRIIR